MEVDVLEGVVVVDALVAVVDEEGVVDGLEVHIVVFAAVANFDFGGADFDVLGVVVVVVVVVVDAGFDFVGVDADSDFDLDEMIVGVACFGLSFFEMAYLSFSSDSESFADVDFAGADLVDSHFVVVDTDFVGSLD
jgi:hypothetical protein